MYYVAVTRPDAMADLNGTAIIQARGLYQHDPSEGGRRRCLIVDVQSTEAAARDIQNKTLAFYRDEGPATLTERRFFVGVWECAWEGRRRREIGLKEEIIEPGIQFTLGGNGWYSLTEPHPDQDRARQALETLMRSGIPRLFSPEVGLTLRDFHSRIRRRIAGLISADSS